MPIAGNRRHVMRNADFSVAVIIVTYNSGIFLARCLRALSLQTLAPTRIIVVDNGSEKPVAELVNKFPRVALVRLSENVGFARANNIAIQRTGDCAWVALLNPDAYPAPDWLEKMLRAARLSPEFAFFGSRMLAAGSPEKLDGIGDCYHVFGLPWRFGHGCRANGRFLLKREIFSPCAAAALYRRDILAAAGGFDESYFCYLEDVDLGFRLRLLGYRCAYVPDALVLHEGSVVTGRRSEFSVYYGHRNVVWTFVKNMPRPALVFFLLPHLVLNCLAVIWYCFRGQGKTVVKAKYDAVRGLPGILKKRKTVQKHRKTGVWPLLGLMSWGFRRGSYFRI